MERDRRLVRGGGFRIAAASEQGAPEPRVLVGVVGPSLDDGARRRLEIVEATEELERVPQVDVGPRLVEVEADRLAALGCRVRVPALREQYPRERRVRPGRVRRDPDDGAIGRLRL